MSLLNTSRAAHIRTILIAAFIVAASSCQPPQETLEDIIESEVRAIERAVADMESGNAGSVEYSVWLGPPDGDAWYRHDASSVRPAASAIKSAILIEFFSEQIESLDQPFAALSDIIDSQESVAIRHFDAEQQAAARAELRDLTARQLAEAMIHKEHIESNAAYNAAANVIIEYLGGPMALTERIRQRFVHADGLQIARYMLADRQENADNLLTADSLASILQYLAVGTANDKLRAAVRNVLLLETDATRGDHYYKGGTLTSAPQVRIEAGWWDDRGAACVYVVIATHPVATGEVDFDVLRSNLGDLSRQIQDAGIRIRDAIYLAD